MGHYYSGRVGKGILFTGLEIASIGAIFLMTDIINGRSENLQMAIENRDRVGVSPFVEKCNEFELLGDCYNYWKNEAESQLKKKNEAQVGRIAAGTAAVGIWLWNTRDVKKNRSSDYSHNSKFSVGVNHYGRIEARINF
jgi:hypothetical protein